MCGYVLVPVYPHSQAFRESEGLVRTVYSHAQHSGISVVIACMDMSVCFYVIEPYNSVYDKQWHVTGSSIVQ